MKKRIIIALSVTVIAIVALVVLIFNIKRGFNVNYEKDMYGFLEKLDAKDKEVIRGELEKYYVERDGYAGFDTNEKHIQYEYEEVVKYKDRFPSVLGYHRDYYKALMVAKRLGDDYAIDVFRDIYANNQHDIESLDIMSYISYVGIMKELGLVSDLKKYFDEIDDESPHTRDFSRELGEFSCIL